MKIEFSKIKNEDTPMLIFDVIDSISGSVSQKAIEKGMDQSFVNSIKSAAAFLKDFFKSRGPDHLSQIDSDCLSNLRIFLRVFALDELEMPCVFIMEATITIGVNLGIIDPISLVFWRKVSPVQYFREHTPLY